MLGLQPYPCVTSTPAELELFLSPHILRIIQDSLIAQTKPVSLASHDSSVAVSYQHTFNIDIFFSALSSNLLLGFREFLSSGYIISHVIDRHGQRRVEYDRPEDAPEGPGESQY